MATVIQAQDKSGKYMKYDTKSKMKYILDYVHDPEKTRSELQGGTLLMNPENAYDDKTIMGEGSGRKTNVYALHTIV